MNTLYTYTNKFFTFRIEFYPGWQSIDFFNLLHVASGVKNFEDEIFDGDPKKFISDEHPDLQKQMRELARGFLWTL